MIYNVINEQYRQKKKEIHKEDFSLLYGWAGISLFLLEYGNIMKNDEIVQLAVEIIDKSYSRDDNDTLDGLLLSSDNKISPYLDNGSSGLGLVLQNFHEKVKGFSTQKRVNILNKVKSNNNLICSANGGLMRGFAGFLPLAILSNDKNQIEFLVDGLNSYFMKSTNSEIVFPGAYNLKCSSNLYSGSAGVLLSLSTLKKTEWNNWIPLYRGGIE